MPPLKSPEFPSGASEWPKDISRRDFVRLAAASAALAGAVSCTRQPLEKIVPYVRQPERVVPGKALYFATAMVLDGFARGILVESHTGRPTKIEGNPNHPASLGATDVFMQAAVLELYDPDRSKSVLHGDDISTWPAFETTIRERLRHGPVHLLTEKTTSPTWIDQIRRIPDLHWHHYEPLDASTLTGNASSPVASLVPEDVDVIVCLDADIFGEGAANLINIRNWAKRRRVWEAGRLMKLFVAEPDLTITGARADHRLAVRASDVETLARQLENGDGPEWSQKAAEELRNGKGMVVAGQRQPASVHEIARSLSPSIPSAFTPESSGGLVPLVEAMRNGEVETLLILGGNPVRNAPVDLNFAEALESVPFSARLGLFEDETSAACDWHLPQAHFLETWSDSRAFDGQVTILQPLIEPLYGGRSPHEVLAAMMEEGDRTGYRIVRDFWGKLPEDAWRKALSNGVFKSPASLRSGDSPSTSDSGKSKPVSGLEIAFRADPCLYDGRFARNVWLRELPSPLSKLSWGNAVLIGAATARRLGLKDGDVVELSRAGRSIRGPVLVQPGHAEDSLTVHLGQGGEAGFDAYPLRTTNAFWFGEVSLKKTGETQRLICTQHHQTMEGRHLVRHASMEEYEADSSVIKAIEPAPDEEETLYPPSPLLTGEQQWGMSIDLNSCVGCNACVVACQSENNIPVVGPEQVARGREMHWIRIDNYFEGADVHFQPVPCMHCENAPCEVVCPVAATVHDSEGLNVQVYNRCVGTRYCSNNCPYKVRRFNFLDFNGDVAPSEKLQKNPDVTIRSRGVMEKCTYCVQRISAARIEAKKENRSIRDGEVRTACQQVCPAEAIIFGDVSDPESKVSKRKTLPLNYALLAETNARPRTTYLGKITHK